MHDDRFEVVLELRSGFEFGVDFGEGIAELLVDEPPPLGTGAGPNPTRLLAAAIGNCLSASLLFCLQKSRIEVASMRTVVNGTIVRNEAGRLRIGSIGVRLEPTIVDGKEERVSRCLDIFEDYCTVTASIRQGLDVAVEVRPDRVVRELVG